MSGTKNTETIKGVYEAFGRGDVAAILAVVTDDVDWGSEASGAGAPWWGIKHGKDEVGTFFEELGKGMEVEEFTPLTFAADANGDVLTVVRYAMRSRETGKLAKMDLHHWFRFTNGKISYYRGTEDTLTTAETLTR
jgi:ketosteroid isomerase-like protein